MIAMSQKQRQKLAKEIEQVTQDYQDRHLHILTVKKNIVSNPNATATIPSSDQVTVAMDDLDDFSSLPPSSESDPLPGLPKKRLQEENQNSQQMKRQRLSIDKRLTLSAVNHKDESLILISTGEKRRSSRRK